MSIQAPDPASKFPIITSSGDVWPHTVFLKSVIQQENVSIGDYTYYNDFRESVSDYRQEIAPYLHPMAPEKLIIGKFTQIGHGTQFITSSANHQMDGFSTYPFAVFGGDWAEAYAVNWPSKGDTVIGNDVWFGHHSLLMPGVSVGDGAIVATRSVVTKDVPPYAIVAGNPARIVRMRFDAETIEQLLEIAWWTWPIEKISQNIRHIVAADLQALKQLV